jgi:hypothetical protein
MALNIAKVTNRVLLVDDSYVGIIQIRYRVVFFTPLSR